MNAMPAGFDAVIDALGGARGEGMNRKVRLRMVVDPRMWDLPAGSAAGLTGVSRGAHRLTITMSGDLRPLELKTVQRWL
jgi:hypothetical protein